MVSSSLRSTRSTNEAAFAKASARTYASPQNLRLGRTWMKRKAQMPTSSSTFRPYTHLSDDTVVFVTYLDATTVTVSRLLPTDRFFARRCTMKLRRASRSSTRSSGMRSCVFSRLRRSEVAAQRFGVPPEPTLVVGTALDDVPEADASRFRQATRITRPYALYHGRLDPSKGVLELLTTTSGTGRAARTDSTWS